MEATAVSLFWIVLCAGVAPLLAGVVPRRLLPEVVLLLLFGVIIGPNVLDLADLDGGIEALQELGLGMLFLLAGYEIEVKELTGRGGRRAFVTWLICFALAFGLILLLDFLGVVSARSAVAIAMISTALGLLLPILKDGGGSGHGLNAAATRIEPVRIDQERIGDDGPDHGALGGVVAGRVGSAGDRVRS